MGAGSAFVGGTGTTITFNGTGAQTIGGAGSTTFHNLTIDKPGSFSTTANTPSFSFVRTNPIDAVGNLTVNNTFSVLRGAFSFCTTSGANFTHNIKDIVLGGPNSTSTGAIPPGPLVSNTEILITNATNANVTVNVSGDFKANTVAPTDGG
ncbi:MAG: hypothetical protein ACK4XY_10875, partial [Chloroherpetonaceae bacterium]